MGQAISNGEQQSVGGSGTGVGSGSGSGVGVADRVADSSSAVSLLRHIRASTSTRYDQEQVVNKTDN